MPVVTTENGHSWQVNQEGSGQTVLFIHGWSVDSRIWAHQLKFFSSKFKVSAVDLPGHGDTPWQDMSLAEIAEDIAGILQSRQLAPAHVVGSSFGGLVGIKLNELHPESLRSLTLVGSQPKFVQADDYPWGLSRERLAKLREQINTDYPSIVPIFFRSLFTVKERHGERFKWLQQFRKSGAVPSREALLILLDRLCEVDLRQALEEVRVPLQFINGDEDPICPKAVYESLQAKMPSARFDWMAGCGHFPFVSQPADFNQLLADFLGERNGE